MLLALAIAYGALQGRRADPAAQRSADAATRALYDNNAGDRDAPPRGGRKHATPPLAYVIVGLLVLWLVVAGVMSLKARQPDVPGAAVDSNLNDVSPQPAPPAQAVPSR